MLSQSTLLLALAALSTAWQGRPFRLGASIPDPQGFCGPGAVHPKMPDHGGGTELPAPPTDVVLKHIAIGHGVQNYECSVADADVLATLTGALAVLYDATSLNLGTSSGSVPSQTVFDSLSAMVATSQLNPIKLNYTATPEVSDTHPPASTTDPFDSSAGLQLGTWALPFLGHHYFDAKTPVFELDTGELLRGTVLDKIAAPSNAPVGPDGQAAVAWLQVGDNGASAGLSYVYRVLTVGGSPTDCFGIGTESVPYAAYYWMFGPE